MSENTVPVKKKGKMKKSVKLTIIFVVIIALIASLFIIYKTNETAISNSVLYMLMPESEPTELKDGTKTDVYIEKNPDYDAKKNSDSPLSGFRFYYTDKDGNKIYVSSDEDTLCQYPESDFQLAFVLLATEKLQNVKSAVKPILIAAAVILIVVLIAVWFIAFCKQEDAEKKRLYGTSDNNGKSKKKKK